LEPEGLLTPYDNFVYALNSKESKRQYPNRLDRFLLFLGLEGTIEQKCNKLYELAQNTNLLQSHLIRFISSQKERIKNKEIGEATLRNYIKAIKLFLSMNDIIVNWKKLSKGVPKVYQKQDRIPTMEEIKKLLNHPDRRIKPIVLTMLSAGLRVGSWEYLKWKHVIAVTRNNNIVAAKIILKNTKLNREYFSFITPEAYNALKEWMDFRALHGEQITGESWLVRNNWEELDRSHHTVGMAKFPKLLNASSIRNIINDAWRVQGVRDFIDNGNGNGEKRHEFKATHCFRKYFETNCQSKMNHNNIKILMDHSFGESTNYHRPTEEKLLEDYLNAVDLLTINEENRLNIKIASLEEKSNEIQDLKRQVNETNAKVNYTNANLQRLAELIESNLKRPFVVPGSKKDIAQKKRLKTMSKDLQKKGVTVAQYFDDRPLITKMQNKKYHDEMHKWLDSLK
jgi:integrase